MTKTKKGIKLTAGNQQHENGFIDFQMQRFHSSSDDVASGLMIIRLLLQFDVHITFDLLLSHCG